MIRVAVFGSCVSRDTCEYLPTATVSAYVARQSSIVVLNPAGEGTFPSGNLESQFQIRMFVGDQTANATQRIIEADPDLILIDLADERRGVWKFPDGTFLTNSIEAYRAGVEKWAPARGARLLRFGTEEHFSLWRSAFKSHIDRLTESGFQNSTVFLDIEWAAALDGQPHPTGGIRQSFGRGIRRMRRRARASKRGFQKGDGILHSLLVGGEHPNETPAESYARRANQANPQLVRYSRYASDLCAFSIRRDSSDLRIDPNHKWGPEPYHYRPEDYRWIASAIDGLPIGEGNG